MSKSVTIPTNMKPFWACEINGIQYSYLAGSTATVPDEVAALVEQYYAALPKEEDLTYKNVLLVKDIKALSPNTCNELKCGDVVVKQTGTQFHSYRVSYKDDVVGEMSLSYVDHQNSEEVYYDKTGGDWAWIVTDITPLGGDSE